jgi:DNA-binding NarL/FixJ family response regulator
MNINPEQHKEIKRILFKDKYGLTDDQMNTLELLTHGLKYAEIADEVYISVGGVNKRVQEIFRKLGVNSRHKAAERARSEWLS